MKILRPAAAIKELFAFREASQQDRRHDDIRSAAVTALGQIGGKEDTNIRAVISNALADPAFSVRSAAVKALGTLYKKDAIPLLIQILGTRESQLRDAAAEVLDDIGIASPSIPPAILSEIRTLISDKGRVLLTMWRCTTQVLLSDINSGDGEKIEGALCTFAGLGDERSIPQLIRVLSRYGTREMAEKYLNCGQPQLGKAAEDWALRNGYVIKYGKPRSDYIWNGW